jgi:hypothetical protein
MATCSLKDGCQEIAIVYAELKEWAYISQTKTTFLKQPLWVGWWHWHGYKDISLHWSDKFISIQYTLRPKL